MSAPVLPAPTPAPPGPPPAPPPRPSRSGPRISATGRAALAALLAAVLLAALNADDLLARARALPFGWQRTAAVDVASAIHRASATLLLDQPRIALDRLFGHERHQSGSVKPVHGTKVTPFRPTAARPVRIYIGGDSVAQAFTDAFRTDVAGRRDIAATVEYRFATGLSRPDYFDWPARLGSVLARKSSPHIVIVMFGANDMTPIMTPSGPAAVMTPAWLAEYRVRVAATMKLLVDAGVDAYWVGQPVMRSASYDRRIQQVDAIYADEAAKHPGIHYIDTRVLFTDADGHYTAYLPGTDGEPVLMRMSDGVHFTPAGGARLAEQVLRVLGQRWPLGLP